MLRDRKTILVITAVLGLVHLVLRPVPPLLGVALIVAGFVVARWPRVARVVVERFEVRGSRFEVRWLLAGLVVVIAAIAFLESRDPFYFTQDDNFSMGPVAIAAGRGFLRGEFPTWNPYQLLGQPTTVGAIYAITYPPMVLCFSIAHLLGREHWYIELFAIAHLIAGYFAMVWAARTLGVRPMLAAAASVSFVLSGSALMITKSYATMAPLVLWAPLLVGLAERFRARAGVKWAMAVAIVIGVFCHSGNGQMWLYGVMFFGFAVLVEVATGGAPPKSLGWLAVAAAFSLAIALPLIVPQMWFMQTVERQVIGGNGIYGYLGATLLPTPLIGAPHPDGWGDTTAMTPFYYAGSVFTACTMLGIILLAGSSIAFRGAREIVRRNVWLLCAAVAFWMSFGPRGRLWSAMAELPVFDKFTGPWKLLIYAHLFAALAGAVLIERWPRFAGAACAIVVALTLYNVTHTTSAFYNYGEDPYPPLPREMRALIGNDRIMPIAADRDPRPGYAVSLALDFPSWYGVPSFDGYDPFVQGTKAWRDARRALRKHSVETARAYGLRWIVEHRSARGKPPLVPGRQRVFNEELSEGRQKVARQLIPYAKLRLELPDVRLYELEGTDPLAFSAGQALPIDLRQDGVRVDVARAHGDVVVNFLNIRGMTARIDGRPAAIRSDRWNRMVVSVPAGSRMLDIRYRGPWSVALLAALGALIAGAIGAVAMRRIEAR